ncbi:hypothetical protein BJH44_004280 [Salmonella enterica subsp. enterica serovar Bredeney]|uniref:PapB/FocB family fimbrial expression transcriptional regulator n=1 Tax=Salmonella enterica TaxID=28901 RepID=UPI0009ACB7A9|nr:hypothetical protein [Salmonella enterica subsp. enterica serovar Bredeney]
MNALRDYFVAYATRNEACTKHEVNLGYFSLKIKELQELNNKLLNYYSYYNQFMIFIKINQ